MPGYRTRFAPSPTGPLHFGSLVAAVGSFVHARAQHGQWLVRMEDIDPPREVPGAARAQLSTLRQFGLVPDRPPYYQSQSAPLHRAALEQLRRHGHAYDCGCSRRDLPADGVYPGTCRNGLGPDKSPRSVRFRVPSQEIEVVDRVAGPTCYRLDRECGDFVIWRADGRVAYQLAVAVDDAAAGITEVVRGRDLLDSAPRQQLLYQALGHPVPGWLHLPLVVDSNGRKLSKSGQADPVEAFPAVKALRLALEVLGHPPPAGTRSLDSVLAWAIDHWQPEQIPAGPFELGQRIY
ncbi:MAG: tRNA glutamyl-Q(34) synthetase GluQRS [Wenzhouxiangellaceae bacterium]